MLSMMTRHGALTLSAALLLSIAGCGGKGPEIDTASSTVIADPSVPSSRSSTPPAILTPTPATSASATATPITAPTTSSPSTTTAKTEGWGTLKGRVVFDGDAPARAVISTDPEKAKACGVTEIKSERLVVDQASKGVKNAIVYIPKPNGAVNPEAKSAKASANVVFDQKKCVFEPHVLAIMTNTKLDIKSSDPVSHNINSKVQNNTFNDAIQPHGEMVKTPVAAARQPGMVTCDIHPWMMAYWLVLDHPYFAVTDDKGNFEIKNAPAGVQKVAVWQEATQFVTPAAGQEVTIAANGETTQEFQIKADKVKPAQ